LYFGIIISTWFGDVWCGNQKLNQAKSLVNPLSTSVIH